jgi:hypothetical protein
MTKNPTRADSCFESILYLDLALRAIPASGSPAGQYNMSFADDQTQRR